MTLIFPVLTAIFAATTLYLTMRARRDSTKRKQHITEALLSCQTIAKKLEAIQESLQSLLAEDPDADTMTDIEMIITDIIRAHFDLKSNKLVLRFNIVEVRDKDSKPLPSVPDTNHIMEMLDRGDSIFLSTRTEIDGFERLMGNSPGFREYSFIREYLLEIRDEINKFNDIHDSFDPQTVRLLQEVTYSMQELIVECAQDKEIRLDLSTLDDSKKVTAYLLDRIAGVPRLRKEVPKIDEIVNAIVGVRKELFRLSHQG